MSKDEQYMRQAIDIALGSEQEGNLPVGAIITLRAEVVAEGGSSILVPKFDGTRHAEMEALRAVPDDLWNLSNQMTLYTTLEPCLMCFASILIHGIGRVVFGTLDNHGGASYVHDHLPPYFQKRFENTLWEGPIMSNECDPLLDRLFKLLEKTQRGLV